MAAQTLAKAIAAAVAPAAAFAARTCAGACSSCSNPAPRSWLHRAISHTSLSSVRTTPQALSPSQEGGYLQSGHVVEDEEPAPSPRFLITGAGGQVGVELVPFLRQYVGGSNVVTSDVRCSKGLASNGPFIYCDVTDKDSLARIVLENGITHIIHLATLLSAIGEKSPQLALRVNTVGIQNVLGIAADNGLGVFAPSTIAVFGNSTPKDQVPDDTVCEPSTMYGITKVHQELLGAYYARKLGVDFRSLRYPGVISAHSPPGGGTTDYAVDMYIAAMAGRPYKCFIAPDTRLPMLYMPDCLRATLELILAPHAHLRRCTYNLTAMSFTPADLEASIRAVRPNFQVVYEPDFRQDIASSWPASIDDSGARADWGWQPEYDLPAMTTHMMAVLQMKAEAKLRRAAASTNAQEGAKLNFPMAAAGA